MQEVRTKVFINMNPQTVTNKLSKRLIKIPKSTEDVSEMIKTNSTEVQSQNRACLIKIISYLRYLARQGLPLRGHGNDQDSNFKQLLKCRPADDPVFSE